MCNKVGLLLGRLVRGLFLGALMVLPSSSLITAEAGPAATPGAAVTDDPRAIGPADAHQSFIRITDQDEMPVRKNIKIGLGKSVLVEFPRDVRDVMVSNPSAVDAVVLSSNRVFLLARKIGEANVFFFDVAGEQFATMEIFIERDTAALENLLNRLIVGSSIKVEMLNQTVVLTGSVKNPTDATRAANISRQFATVQYEVVS